MFSHEIRNWRSFLAIFKPQKCLNILLVKQLEWISSIPWDRKSKWVLEMHLSGSLKYTCILEIVCIDSKKQQQQKKNHYMKQFFIFLLFLSALPDLSEIQFASWDDKTPIPTDLLRGKMNMSWNTTVVHKSSL